MSIVRAATLLLLRKSSKPKGRYDYEILAQVRSAKSKFWPGLVTFPGGHLEEQDQHPDWQKYLGDPQLPVCGFPLYTEPGMQRAQLTCRLAAIRETFEETGVLVSESGGRLPPVDPADKELNFLQLCRQGNVTPAVNQLIDWNCWLTPNLPNHTKRFHTVFYLSFLRQDDCSDFTSSTESQSTCWISIPKIFQQFRKGALKLAPPQYVELSRLATFTRLQDLHQFVTERLDTTALTLCCPIHVKCPDGSFIVYPGDEIYPLTIDPFTQEAIKSTSALSEHQKVSSSPRNRMFFVGNLNPASPSGFSNYEYICNVARADQLPLPLSTAELTDMTAYIKSPL